MEGVELGRGLPAGHGGELITRTLGPRPFLLGFADQPGPVKTKVELPYLLEAVSPIANATESLEHLRLVFRRVGLEHLRTAGGRLLGRPTPQVREQVDLQPGSIEGYDNLAVALRVLLRRSVHPVDECDRLARHLPAEGNVRPALARVRPAVSREH